MYIKKNRMGDCCLYRLANFHSKKPRRPSNVPYFQVRFPSTAAWLFSRTFVVILDFRNGFHKVLADYLRLLPSLGPW